MVARIEFSLGSSLHNSKEIQTETQKFLFALLCPIVYFTLMTAIASNLQMLTYLIHLTL